MKKPVPPSNFRVRDPDTRDDLRRLREGFQELLDWIDSGQPDLGLYLKKLDAAATYLTITTAATTYLKRSAGDFSTFPTKGTPTSSDVILIEDAAAGGAKKAVTIGSLPAGAAGSTWTDINVQPASGSADDDDFNGTTIAAAWLAIRQDTSALVTPTVGVDLFTNVGTVGTMRWQQGYRNSWLTLQPYDIGVTGTSTAVYAYKALATNINIVGGGHVKNAIWTRWARTSSQLAAANRDGSVSLTLAADVAGLPDFNNRLTIMFALNVFNNTATLQYFKVIAGAPTTIYTRNLDARSFFSGDYERFGFTDNGGGTIEGWAGGGNNWEQLPGSNTGIAIQFKYLLVSGNVDVQGGTPQSMIHFDYVRRRVGSAQLP